MLVLTRKNCESIRIGNDISIVILDIQGGKVRLGIEAPKDVAIVRDEIISDQRETIQRKASLNLV